MNKDLEALKYFKSAYNSFLKTKNDFCQITFSREQANEFVEEVEAVEKKVKALEIIKKNKNIKFSFYENGSGKHYKIEFDKTRNQTITKEEFNLLKEVLE